MRRLRSKHSLLTAENRRLRRRVAALERRLLAGGASQRELVAPAAGPAGAQLEALALQGEQLAASARMAALVAHELNTPLQAAENELFLAALDLPDPERLRPLQDEIRRIGAIVRRLLSFPPTEYPRPAPLAINELVERVLLLTGGRLHAQRVCLVRRLDPALPAVFGHDHQLTLVLVNLVLRAAEALPAGGELLVATRAGTRPAEPTVTIELCYSGVEQPVRGAARAPFYSTDAASPEQRLEVCRHLLAGQGGGLVLWEELGGSQRAMVTLPLRNDASVDLTCFSS